jgi:hypothetical protein
MKERVIMGRPKGSKDAPEDKTSKRMVREEMRFITKDQGNMAPLQIVTEIARYRFKNIGNSMFFVTPKNGKETKTLKPLEIRDDFTDGEREYILKSQFYKMGYVVEVMNEDLEEIINPNSVTDKQIDKVLLMDNDEIKAYILTVDSVFTLDRIRKRIVEQDLPAHLVSYADSRAKELKQKYQEEDLVPVETD